MKLNVDYNNSLTNLACSILKYFDCTFTHKTLKIVDDYLNEFKPKNVVLMLCDGMGYNILNRTLDKNKFLIKNLKGSISSVFPATTTACTTSITTGLNPVEHCWLGWENYIKELNEVVIMYQNKIKDTEISLGKENICKKLFNYKTIIDRINHESNNEASLISCFENECYTEYNDMFKLIKSKLNIRDKNYIYAYWKNPDELMHNFGSDSFEAVEEINRLNNEIEKFCNELTDTVIFVIADHGHINIDYIYLEDYKEIFDLLERTTSVDARASMMFVKEGFENEFKNKFNNLFGEYFDLLSKEDIKNTNLFGDGSPNKLFDSCLGSFIAIAKSNKAIKYQKTKEPMVSTHAGNTLDETLVPLIMVHR